MPQHSVFIRDRLRLGASVLGYTRLFFTFLSYMLLIVGLFCQVAGLVSVNNNCHDDPYQSCSDFLRYDWWTTDFQLLVAVFIFLTQYFSVHRYMLFTITVFVAVCIVQLILSAEKYLYARRVGADYKAAAAGYILSAMGFIVLSLSLGGELPVDTTPGRSNERRVMEMVDGSSPRLPTSRSAEPDNADVHVPLDGRSNDTMAQRYRALVPQTQSSRQPTDFRSTFRLDSTESLS